MGVLRRLRALTVPQATLLSLLLALGFRTVLRDRWVWSELLFLVPQAAYILGIGVLVLIVYWKKFIPRLAGAGFCLVFGLPLFAQEGASAPRSEGTLRIVCWNIMSGNRGIERVSEELAGERADVICLLEGTMRQRPPEPVVNALPGFEWAARNQMAIGAAEGLRDARFLPTGPGLSVFAGTLEVERQSLTIVVVDVLAPFTRSTRQVFLDLETALAMVPQPYIMLGDFNTDAGSWHLEHATAHLQRVDVGGLRKSWPLPVPLWQIDHAFASRGVQVHRAELRWGASDHARMVLEIGLEEP